MNRSIHFRVSEAWYSLATSRAEKLGLSLSEYIRSTISKDFEGLKMESKAIKVLVHWGMGGNGLYGKYYNPHTKKWEFVSNPPSTHWEAYEEMKKSDALLCPRCGHVSYQHLGENWDEVEYDFNVHLSFLEEA